jgi:N-acetylmuramoyl-L-alanine amidase
MKPINNILPNIAKDFASIKMGLLKVSKFQQKEERERYFTKAKERASNYERAVRARQVLGSTGKKVAKGATSVVGYIMLLGGIIGIVKLITSINIGQYMVKFITNTFSALFDVAKKSVDVITGVLGDQEVQNSFLKTIKAVFTFLGLVLIKGFDIAKDILNDSDIQEKVKSVFQSVLNNVVDVVSALYDILTQTLVENVEKLKTGIVEIFSAITDLIVAAIIAIQDFVSDDRIRASLSNVAVAVMDFIKVALTQEYDDPKTGKKVVAWHKALEWVAEAAFVTGIFLYWKARFLQMGAVLAASGLTGINDCDCSDLLPDELERRKRGRTTRPKPKSGPTLYERGKERLKKAGRYVADKATQFKNAFIEGWKTAQKNIKVYAEKVGRYVRVMATNTKIQAKVLSAFSKRFGKAAAARIGAFLTAQAAALVAAPVTGGLSLIVSILLAGLAAYDIYCLYDLLFVSTDGKNEDGGLAASLNTEIEKEERDTSPKPVATDTARPYTAASSMSGSSTPAPVPAPAVATAPTPAPVTTEAPTNWSADAMGVPAGVSLEKRNLSLKNGGPRKKTDGVVIHHTGGNSLQVAVDTLKQRGLSYHYLVDRDGKVVQVLPDNLIGWHSYPSNKKPEFNNSNTISISMVAADDKNVTAEQIAAATSLESMLAKKYGFTKTNAYGHGEVSSSKNPTEGLTIASAIRSGTTNQAIEKVVELNTPKTPEIIPDTTKAKAGDILTTASNEFNSGLRMLEDLFVTGRPSFTNMSTTINQSNTISRPGGNLRTKEDASIQLLIQRQTM